MSEDHVFQHYVPKFYLRNFSDSDQFLHCIRVGSSDTNVNDNNTFWLNAGEDADMGITASDYFYDETKNKQFEKGLADFEGGWADSVRNLLSEKSIKTLSEEIKADLLAFIVMQYIRTRESREQLVDAMERLGEGVDDSDLEEMSSEYAENDGRESHLVLMKAVTELLFERLHQHGEFYLYENNSDIPFITSDNPVVQYSQNKPNKFDYQDAIGVAGTDWEIYVPLNPDYCLAVRCVHKFGEEIGKSVVYNEFVKAHNKLQLVNATDIGVCNNASYDGIKQVWDNM